MTIETQFGQFAERYVATRPAYPEGLFQEIVSAVAWPHERALDLGAGTGLSTLPLCRWFDRVIAIEPDAGMAVNLQNLSPKIEVRQCGAQELNETPASIDLITMGNTLYWLDGSAVIQKALTWLRPEGILAVYRYGIPCPPEPIQDILQTEFKEHWNSFRHPRLLDDGYSHQVISSQAGFQKIRVVTVPHSVSWNSQQLIGYFCATSYCSAYLKTLEAPDRYIANLQKQIDSRASHTPFSVDFSLELITAKKA